MTKEKFQNLCEQVLLPKIGDLLFRNLRDIDETLEIFGRELARIEEKIDGLTDRLDASR